MRTTLTLEQDVAEILCREVERTGKAMKSVVNEALRSAFGLPHELAQSDQRNAKKRLANELDIIALRCAHLPVLDERTSDEILGYNDSGIPDSW